MRLESDTPLRPVEKLSVVARQDHQQAEELCQVELNQSSQCFHANRLALIMLDTIAGEVTSQPIVGQLADITQG